MNKTFLTGKNRGKQTKRRLKKLKRRNQLQNVKYTESKKNVVRRK